MSGQTTRPETAALPLVHRLWRRLPQAPRRAALNHLTAALAPRPGPAAPVTVPGLVVAGELARASGLGEGARLMLAAASQLGVPPYALTLGDREAPLPPPGVPLVIHVNSPHMAAALLGLPRRLVQGRRVIGYWAWDLPVVPDAWRAGLRFVHEVWVPSRFTQSALAPLLPGRLRRVPHPVAIQPIQPAPLTRADFGFPANAVVVLANFSLASSFERKNPLGMIAAFRAAFADRPDRLLVIKLGHHTHFPTDFARLQQAAAGIPNIRIDTTPLPTADLHAMTACADIVLSLHRAEGFGLVPAEAMLLGRPVIATGWSGNMDYMDAHSAALVGYRLVPAIDPRGVFSAPGAVWAEPDQADAVAHLRHLAEDTAARAQLGAAAALHARAQLGAASLRQAIDALMIGPT
jgi:glycosyltransferase involved in cell wall biosynthesis